MPDHLAAKDLRALMSVIDDGKQDEPTAAMPWAVLEGLGRLIACDFVSFFDFDMAGRRKVATQETCPGERELWTDFEDEPYFDMGPDFLPAVYFTRTGDLSRVIGWSDFFSRRELHNHPFFAESFAPDGRRNAVPCLTRREQEVLRLAARGRSNADIARHLFITVSTVRKHLEHIYDRTGARSRTAAAALVMPHLDAPTITPRT